MHLLPSAMPLITALFEGSVTSHIDMIPRPRWPPYWSAHVNSVVWHLNNRETTFRPSFWCRLTLRDGFSMGSHHRCVSPGLHRWSSSRVGHPCCCTAEARVPQFGAERITQLESPHRRGVSCCINRGNEDNWHVRAGGKASYWTSRSTSVHRRML